MPSVNFQKKLVQLQDDVMSLGNMVQGAIERSIEALRERDLALARRTVRYDRYIDRKRFAIEEECIRLMAARGAEVSDRRFIVAVLGIITELERIGDYAEGIANITLMIGEQPPLKPLVDIPRMAERGVEMLRRSLESFVEKDAEKARRICRQDDEVDALYDQVFRELVFLMIENPKNVTRATWLLWTAHNLERLADRVTNICERVVFSVTGTMVDIGASKY